MWTSNRRITAMGILLLGALAITACGGGSGESSDEADVSPVVVQLNPKTAIVGRAETQPIKAVVSGTSETAVTWDVDGIVNGNGTVGTISGSGNSIVYRAPALDGTHFLVATSVADVSKTASAKIVVRDSCAPEPSSSVVLIVTDEDYGATGDDSTDDTDAIQEAVDQATGKGWTVLIPSGTYIVDAAGGGIRLGSAMTLHFESGSILKARATSADSYKILRVNGVSNVNITGSGILQGERASHLSTTGEDGHGLNIENSHDVVVKNLTSQDCWGDGFYVGSGSTGVSFCNVLAYNNRRAGISITSVDGLTIRNSVFQNTHGTLGECGLDIEPNEGETVLNVKIQGSTFSDNAGPGLAAGVPCAHNGTVSNLLIEGNTVQHNGWNGISGPISGILISKCSGTQIIGNTATGNAGDGILLRNCSGGTTTGANHSLISGNTVSNNELYGIREIYCDDNTIISNTGSGNKLRGIQSSYCLNRHISTSGSTANTVNGGDVGITP